MSGRNRWALLALSLLALTAGCTSVVGEFEELPAPGGQAGGITNAPSDNAAGKVIGASPVLEGAQLAGVSSMSIPGHLWAEPTVGDGVVNIPLAVATIGDHFHFEVAAASGPIGFIACQLGDQFHVFASLCPSCGGKNIDYGVGLLACPDCDATFNPQTGARQTEGRGYPEGSISYFIDGDNFTSRVHTLTVAYERTASGEATLFEGPAKPDAFCSSCGV